MPFPPLAPALATALACLAGLTGCAPGPAPQLLRLELDDPAQVAGPVTLTEDGVYSIGLEVQPLGDSVDQRDYLRGYFEIGLARPLIAHVALTRAAPAANAKPIVDETIEEPEFSSWNTQAMTMNLVQRRLPAGRYDLRATLTGRTFRSEDYRAYLVVERVRAGQ